jgi:hypothetical protein
LETWPQGTTAPHITNLLRALLASTYDSSFPREMWTSHKRFQSSIFQRKGFSFNSIASCITTNVYGNREQIYHNLVLLHNAGYIHGDLGPYNVLHAPDNSGFRIVDLESVREHKCRALSSVSSASLLMRSTKSCKSLQAMCATLRI